LDRVTTHVERLVFAGAKGDCAVGIFLPRHLGEESPLAYADGRGLLSFADAAPRRWGTPADV
jgi:hypothetical protein